MECLHDYTNKRDENDKIKLNDVKVINKINKY